MAKFPSKPQHGQSVIKAFGDSINEIIDYLPQLEVRGDQKSTYVEHSSAGTIIHTKQNANTNNSSAEGETLSAGRFLQKITTIETSSGTVTLAHPVLNCILSGGRFIEITDDGLINYTGPSGGGGTGSGYLYIGDGDLGSGHIFVDYTYENPVICSNLVHIDDLLNYNISANNHFLQNRDLKEGAGTTVNYHYNSTGSHAGEGGPLISYINGLEIDLNVSGGQYIRGTFYKGLGYDGDNDIASIDCLLSGSNFIKIVPVQESDGLTGGVISTILHAGSGIFIDPDTGEIRCTVTPSPGPGPSNYYYTDNDTLSTINGNTFYVRDVQKLLEGRGGTYVGHLSSDESGHEITLISSANVPTKLSELTNDEGFITASDIPPGNIYYAGSGLALSSDNKTFYLTAHIPLSTSELVNDVPFLVSSDLDAYYKVSGYQAVGDHLNFNPHYGSNGRLDCTLTDGNFIHIDELEQINCTLSGLDQLANTPGYITEAQIPPGGNEYFTGPGLATSGADNNVFYLTGTVLSGGRLIDINSNNIDFKLSAGNNINFNEDKINCTLTDLNQLTNSPGFITSAQIPSSNVYGAGFGLTLSSNEFYLTGSVLSSGSYVSINNNQIDFTLSAGKNINYTDNKINCSLTGLDQLQNTPGFITQSQVPPGSVYKAGDGIALSSDNQTFYLTGTVLSGGDFIDINSNNIDFKLSAGTNINFDGNKINCQITGLNQLDNATTNYITQADIPPSTTYIGTSGIGIETILQNNQPTTSSNVFLSAEFYNTLTGINDHTSGKVLSTNSSNEIVWTDNVAQGGAVEYTSLTPSLLAIDNNNHTISAATQSGGGSGGGGGGGGGNFAWPHWENMCGSGHLVYVQQWYTTQDGGWLRISNKENTTFSGCNSLYIDPVVPPAGVEGQNHIGLGVGKISFFLPIPPGSSFWIGLEQGAQCWFDGTTTPPTHTTEDVIVPQQIRDNSLSAVEACSVASSKCSDAENTANAMKSDYEGYVGQDNLYDPQWYKDHYYDTINYSNEATAAKNSCISYANACQTAYNSYDGPDKANYTQYVTDANNAVTDATSYATSAATQIDVASYYYDLAYDYWQAHHPQWFVDNPDYTKYDQ